MADDPQPQTLQQRIAMLNASHLGRAPTTGSPVPRPKPQLPNKRPDLVVPHKRPDLAVRQHSVNNPPAATAVSVPVAHNLPIGAQQNGVRPPPPQVKAVPPPQAKTAPPALPVRRPSDSPALPPRRPSERTQRSDSVDSTTSSLASGVSSIVLAQGTDRSRSKSRESIGRIKAPAWDPATLPPVPTRQNGHTASSTASSAGTNGTVEENQAAKTPKPSLPPRLPPRKSTNAGGESRASVEERRPAVDVSNSTRPSALAFGMNKDAAVPSKPLVQPNSIRSVSTSELPTSGPPPVPLGSRPDLAKLQATKPRSSVPTHVPLPNSCMLCRDFSGPDNQATKFPRQSLPQQNALSYLAHQLTSPFSSLTDKARAIFTWLHHNILYDVQSFFAGTVKPSTPASTLATGLAVCEGFAGLFTTLATHAGLESMVLSGHGKGFGYHPLGPGQPIPPFEVGHAWNVVRIDGGEWKLVDPCWGAGHVQGHGMPYQQKFAPRHFTMSNEEFGIKHFPSDRSQLYLPGGTTMTWEQYIVINPAHWPYLAEQPTVFSDATESHGVGPLTILPTAKKISPRQNANIRFQFGLVCPHWDLDKHTRKGPPFVYVLAIHGLDGRKDDFIPLEHVRSQTPGEGGDLWYVDVDARELGAPGQTVTLFAVTSFGNRKGDACRGLTVREYKEGKGRTAMGFQGVIGWELG